MSNTKEGKIQSEVLTFLNNIPESRFYNLHGGAIEGKGKPDVIGAHKGTPYAFELKTSVGRLDPAQIKELKLLKRAGYKTYTCRSLQDVYNAIFKGDMTNATT